MLQFTFCAIGCVGLFFLPKISCKCFLQQVVTCNGKCRFVPHLNTACCWYYISLLACVDIDDDDAP